mgnify:CR=1 FL=1
MGKCLIFCAGDFDALAQPVEKGDCIIAADGGVKHTEALAFIEACVAAGANS